MPITAATMPAPGSQIQIGSSQPIVFVVPTPPSTAPA